MGKTGPPGRPGQYVNEYIWVMYVRYICKMMRIFISGLHLLFQGLPGIRGEKGESGEKGFEVWGFNVNVILELIKLRTLRLTLLSVYRERRENLGHLVLQGEMD